MQTIDIVTTQNVVIRYELANLRDRILAYFLDMVILYFSLIILTAVFASALDGPFGDIFGWFIVLPSIIFYTLASELLMKGQTLGKKAVKIRIVRVDGKPPSTVDYVTRWAFRVVDILFSFGGIASILISSTDKAQRLGGIVSNTTLIRTNPREKISLHNIMKISNSANYVPKYMKAREFNEEEMLLIKSVIERFKKFDNPAHQKALDEAVAIVKHRLQMDKTPFNQVEFLQSVIKDYIVLTR